jgi:CDP-diacylglycerol--glycerol-3-phosphate 3-phosphatidyltransferase
MADPRDLLRIDFQPYTEPLIDVLVRYGVTANQVTYVSLLITCISSILVYFGWLLTGGVLFIAASVMDSIDGQLARRTNTAGQLGGLIDSTFDRLSEGFMLIAISGYLANLGDINGCILSGVTLLMSQMTSYLRALAESRGVSCTVGIATRVERVYILSIAIMFNILLPCLILLSILCTITTVQRFLYIRNELLNSTSE